MSRIVYVFLWLYLFFVLVQGTDNVCTMEEERESLPCKITDGSEEDNGTLRSV